MTVGRRKTPNAAYVPAVQAYHGREGGALMRESAVERALVASAK